MSDLFPESKGEVASFLKQNFETIKKTKTSPGPISRRDSLVLSTVGKFITTLGMYCGDLSTEELFAAILVVNGTTKHRNWEAAYCHQETAKVIKNQLQKIATGREGVKIIRPRPSKPRNFRSSAVKYSHRPDLLEIRYDIWDSHLPVGVAKRLKIFVPDPGKSVRIVKKK